MTQFTEEVIMIIKNIPSGSFMSYGQIARLAGNPRGARQVARILHSMTVKYDLPWHRVVNAQGRISIKDPNFAAMQRDLLRSEGVNVSQQGECFQ